MAKKLTPGEVADVKAVLMTLTVQQLSQIAINLRTIPEHVVSKLSEAERQIGHSQYDADVRALETIDIINEFIKPIRAMLLTRNTNE